MARRRIIFVCNGNIHRSVIAALRTQQLLEEHGLADGFEILSRGLQGTAGTTRPLYRNLREYPSEWALTGPALDEIGLEIPASQTTTPITRGDVEQAALVLAMDDLVLQQKANSLMRQFPEYRTRMRLFSQIAGEKTDVPDPAGNADPKFHLRVVRSIDETLRNNLQGLLDLVAQAR